MEKFLWILGLITTSIIIGVVVEPTIQLYIVVTIASIGTLIVMLLVVFWFLPYIPFAIKLLANDPNAYSNDGELDRTYEPSTFGFFTGLQPGQVKIIERNERFVRCVMRFDGHTFAGAIADSGIPRNSERYWQVIKTPSGARDFYPVVKPWLHDIDDDGRHTERKPKWWEPIFYRWCNRVYDITGFVFTGIYPFQTVRVYPMDRYKLDYDNDGNVKSAMKKDYSDHYRVEDFQFGVVIPKADTKDKVPVKIVQNFIGRVANPYEVAYSTDDDWGARLLSVIANAVTNWTRITPLENVLSATDGAESEKLTEAVLRIEVEPEENKTEEDVTKGIRAFGLKAIDNYVLDISPADDEFAKGLARLAQARVDRDANIELAKGTAAMVEKPAKVAEKYGEFGEIALRNQGMIDTAKVAGDKAIVMFGTQSVDPMTAKVERNTRKET